MSNLFEKGTIALVTGGSSGIGQACAIDLAKHGAYVIINYSGHKEGAQETLDAVLKAGGAGAIIRANVSVEEDVDNMFKKIMANFKRLDILVNNAGIIRDGYLLMMKKDQAAVRIMAGQKRGAIVNISSTSGITGSEGQANYSASKAGIIGFTKTVAKEYASKGIRVNAVAPGFIDTKMTHANKELLESKYLQHIPMGRFGEPEDIAHAVTFLASDLASYVTGKVLTVDGGMTM